MVLNEFNVPIVDTIQELKEAKSQGYSMVYAICPKCKDGTTSNLYNAEMIITEWCIPCNHEFNETSWEPKIEVK